MLKVLEALGIYKKYRNRKDENLSGWFSFSSGSDKWRTLGVPTSFRLLGGGGWLVFMICGYIPLSLRHRKSRDYNDDLPVALIPFVSTDSEGGVYGRLPLHLRGAEI